MAANAAAAYGMYPQNAALSDIVHTLNKAGFGNEDICMMLSPTHPIASLVRDANFFNSERDSDAVTAGLIGWLSEFGAVIIPTVGFFIRSQAFFHALMTSRDDPGHFGNTRALVGLGFSKLEAQRFEKQLCHFGTLVYVSCRENAKSLWAREVLHNAGAQEAATLEEIVAETLKVAAVA
jgi:hypothetical protein